MNNMKKIKLVVLIFLACLLIQNTFAQKGKINDAQLSLQDGKVMDAKKSIDAALLDSNVQKITKAWNTKGDVYRTIYEGKIFYPQNPNCLFEAKEAYLVMRPKDANKPGKVRVYLDDKLVSETDSCGILYSCAC